MKFFVDNYDLNAAISTATKALTAKSAVNILEGIYVDASEGKLHVKCSDLSLQIETEIPATIEEEGVIVFPGRIFADIIRKLPNDLVDISVEGTTAYIKCGRINTTIQCFDAQEYPEMAPMYMSEGINISQNKLKSMIRQTKFSASVDESKGILNGILVEVKDNNLTMVALDGYRLAIRKEQISGSTLVERAVIPPKALNEMANILEDSDEPVKMHLSMANAMIDLGHTKLLTRLLEGEYIKYSQILPKEYEIRVKVNRQEFYESIDRASLLARENKNNLVKFSFENDYLHITANNEIGKINEDVPVQIMGGSIDISFNSKFIIDILKNLDDDELYLDLTKNISPCVFRGIRGDEFYYLVLPIRPSLA